MKTDILDGNNITKKQRNIIMIVIMMGSFLTTLTQTVLTSALPSIMSDFSVSANTGQWLTTAYMLVLGVMIPATAYLINRFTTRKLFISSMALFLVGCILSINAQNFTVMIASRILQALGAGVLMQLVQILMMSIYPVEERGSALGIYGFVVGVAPTVGPIVAGAIIDSFGWRVLFYILAAIAAIDIILAVALLKNVGETKSDKLDIISLSLSTFGFGGLLIGVSNRGAYGWEHILTYMPLVIGILSLVIFIHRQLTVEKPLLNIRVFKSKIFAVSTILSIITSIAMTFATMMISLYVQSIRGYSAFDSGLLMMPGSILLSILSPITGKMFDKYGARRIVIPGFIFLGIGTGAFAFLGESTSLAFLSFMFCFRMIGIAFLLMTVTTWGINSLKPEDIPSGSAISSTLRQVAGSIGSAIFMTIMTSVSLRNSSETSIKVADIKGMNTSFFIATVLIVVGLVLSIIYIKDINTRKEEKEKLKEELQEKLA